MTPIAPPPVHRLPSPARLRRHTAIAAAVAAVLLIVVVLPAERAIDPTGLGDVLGLTEMGLIKQEFKAEIAAAERDREAKRVADSTTAAEKDGVRALLSSGAPIGHVDTTTVAVRPGEEVGVEMEMETKAWVAFEWTSPRALDFDVRGDSAGAPDWWYYRYHSSDASTAGNDIVVSKFSGTLGLYWKNDRDSTARVTIVTRGTYLRLATPRR